MSDGADVLLPASDRSKALATLVSAFIGDPLERWLYPEAWAYLTHFPRFIESFAGPAFEADTAWCLGDYTAVALWLPPATEADGDAIAGVIKDSVSPAKHRDAFAVLDLMAHGHPTGPHWYLSLLGVDSAHQGLGLGARLLTAGLKVVDADHLPTYLETPNPRTVPFYERHGFVVTGRAQAGTCPPLVGMLRPARSDR